MQYRLVVLVTDDVGGVSEEALQPPVDSETGWRCAHAIWPSWAKEPGRRVCDFCHEPLVPCEIVECPWCERLLATEEAVAHWRDGCEE